jgi:hypothetical protein
MSSELDQLRARQEVLEGRQDLFEGRLGMLELGAETQTTKRAIMEQGIADVKAEQRAQRSLLHAVHKTQSEHTADIRDIKGRLGNVEGRLGQVEEKLGNVHIGVQAILAVLDRKIDEEEPGQ